MDTAAYLERIRTLADGNEPLGILDNTAPTIGKLIEGVPESRLKARPQPGKWSVVEIIAHLAEDELVASWRYRQMLESPGCALPGFDQDKWAAYGHYGEWEPAEALAMFTMLRRANVRLLRHLEPEEWTRGGVHSERGPTTVADLALHMAGHDRNHLEQMRKILLAE